MFAVAAAGHAFAEDYPARPVRLIVAFAPGGSTDVTARVIADKMQGFLGQSVVVENKPGANGAIAAEYVAKSDPDGYALFYTTVGAVAINPTLRSNLPYDPIRDFAAVGEAAVNATMLVVNAALPVNSAREFADLARKKPGAITIGVTGIGAVSDLALELFKADAGIELQAVPYRGAALAITDVIGGHLDGVFADVPTVLPQLRAAKVKALGIAPRERSDIFPDVPTFVEQGYPNTVADNWAGVLAPAGTPPPVIARVNAAMVAALNDPDLRGRLHNAGTTPAPSSPAQFEKYLRDEIARWAKLIREKGIKVQ
jgi:tripartite-type tricarboxylate transporter receptor subunit TctC